MVITTTITIAMSLDRYILKGYDLSGGANNWVSDDISGYVNYSLELIWSNVTGVLDGELLVRETDDNKLFNSLETVTVDVADKNHLIGNVDLGLSKISVKFSPVGITGGRLSIRVKAKENVSLISDIFRAGSDAFVILGSLAKRFKDLYLSRELFIGSLNNFVQIKNEKIGIGTIPTLPLDVKAKSGHTTIGGFAIKLTNKTGGNTVQGQLIEIYSATAIDDAFRTCDANSDAVIAIIYEAGIADGDEAWVVISGIADVLMDGGGSARHDRIISSSTAGSADVWNVGGAVATHFQEIGHCLETRTGSGLARCIIHFN